MDLSHEVLKPGYVMCNECKNLNKDGNCKIYNGTPPKEILGGNPFRKKDNTDICEHFDK